MRVQSNRSLCVRLRVCVCVCVQPPPRRPQHLAQSNENEEEKQFRRVFQQLAGDVSSSVHTSLKSFLFVSELQIGS